MKQALPSPNRRQARADNACLTKAINRGDLELASGNARGALNSYLTATRAIHPRVDALEWLERMHEKIMTLPDPKDAQEV